MRRSLISQQVEAALARKNDIQIAVAVEVDDHGVVAGADRATVGQHGSYEPSLVTIKPVGANSELVFAAGIVAVMSVAAFSSHHLRNAVGIKIRQHQAVGLRPRRVDALDSIGQKNGLMLWTLV